MPPFAATSLLMRNCLFVIIASVAGMSICCAISFGEDKTSLTLKLSGKQLSIRQRKAQEEKFERLEIHQNAVREVEALGYTVEYDLDDEAQAANKVPAFLSSSAYVRSSLEGRIVSPVVRILAPYDLVFVHCWGGDSMFQEGSAGRHLSLKLLLCFPKLKAVDLSQVTFTPKDLKELESLTELQKIIVPDKMASEDTLAELQVVLPNCEFKSRQQEYSGLFLPR